jgi:hypothetical protein
MIYLSLFKGMRLAAISVLLLVSVCFSSSAFSELTIPDDLLIDFSSLVVPESELMCLALNDYFEARGESFGGRIAVARVVINRAMDKRFPSEICNVIKQNKTRSKHRCQFSWYCDGRSDVPYNSFAWRWSLKIAAAILQKDSNLADLSKGSLWYHATFVKPIWAKSLVVSTIVGDHIFYKDPPENYRARSKKWRDPMVPDLHAFSDYVLSQKLNSTVVASR